MAAAHRADVRAQEQKLLKGRLALATALLASIAVLLPIFARAESRVADANDQHGKLDVKEVRTFGRNRPGWKTITFENWKTRKIFVRGNVLVFLDTRWDERPEYYAVVYSDADAKIRALLYRDHEDKPDKKKGKLHVWRKNRHSVSVRIHLSDLHFDDNRTYYEWYVETLWSGDKCESMCFDYVPGKHENHVRVPRPGYEQSPTPTPTLPDEPTPSPSPLPSPTGSESPSPLPSPSASSPSPA